MKPINVWTEFAQALFGLSQVARARGDIEAARSAAAESAEILTRIGHRQRAQVVTWKQSL